MSCMHSVSLFVLLELNFIALHFLNHRYCWCVIEAAVSSRRARPLSFGYIQDVVILLSCPGRT
jgi:hypothetical protein